MAQIYRIYINDTVVVISHFLPPDVEKYKQLNALKFNFISFYKKVKNKPGQVSDYLLLVNDAKATLRSIKKSVTVIKAAGGLVRNEENKALFIFRKGVWDLPKGKLDAGEKTRKAAVREVEEECGIKVNECGKKICKTWHAYEAYGQLVLKPTTWYVMKAFNQPALIPQLEEGITDAQWIAPADFYKVKENTFPLILDVMGFAE